MGMLEVNVKNLYYPYEVQDCRNKRTQHKCPNNQTSLLNPPNMFLLKVSLTIVYQEKRMLFRKRIGYLEQSKNNPRVDKL